MPTPEIRQVLITVKAYPNPSVKYGETVCCAGIDIETFEWVRLYPIPYRDLDESQKFEKYSIIKVRCWKAEDDHRIESYKVDADSIEKVDHIGTDDNWGKRKRIVLPTVSTSFCEIVGNTEKNKSIGVFQPVDVRFSWKKASMENEDARNACYAQLCFFEKSKKAIEQIPFDFYYDFKCCNTPDCLGHKLPIVDWEIGQAYRSWRYNYQPSENLLAKIRERWLDRICSVKNDVYFFVGNMKRFRDKFMVLGVFYPKKKK